MKIVSGIVQAQHEIRVGDMFKASDNNNFNNNNFYILLDLPDCFSLQNLEGRTTFRTETSFHVLTQYIKEAVSQNRLIHYPKSKYSLLLQECGGES